MTLEEFKKCLPTKEKSLFFIYGEEAYLRECATEAFLSAMLCEDVYKRQRLTFMGEGRI